MRTLVAVDYNPNKHRHIAYKPQDVMNWVLQPWYKEMLSMNHLLVRVHTCPYKFKVQKMPVGYLSRNTKTEEMHALNIQLHN